MRVLKGKHHLANFVCYTFIITRINYSSFTGWISDFLQWKHKAEKITRHYEHRVWKITSSSVIMIFILIPAVPGQNQLLVYYDFSIVIICSKLLLENASPVHWNLLHFFFESGYSSTSWKWFRRHHNPEN